MCSKLRPHHGLCISFFDGKGYSSEFVAHMKEVIQKLEKNPEITLILKEDTICSCCPNMNANGCKTKDKVLGYDRRVLELCGLEEGICISWEQLKHRVQEYIIEAGNMKQVCGDCGWAEICHFQGHKKDTDSSKIHHI